MIESNAAKSQRAKKRKGECLGFGSLEIPKTDTFSKRSVRTRFIQMVDSLEPKFAATLYDKAFFQFLCLAWPQFPQACPPPVSAVLGDSSFLMELERIVKDFSASPVNPETQTVHSVFALMLIPFLETDEKRQLLVNSPRGVLMSELLRPLRKVSEEVSDRFPDWAALKKNKNAKLLRERLVDWSKGWNLDADWCQDYAVAALCDWLGNAQLPWRDAWYCCELSFRRAAVSVNSNQMWMSWVYTNNGVTEALSKQIQDFKFCWKGLNFEFYRWHPWTRQKESWAQECQEKFKAYIEEHKNNGGTVPPGAVNRFLKQRKEYLRNIWNLAKPKLSRSPRSWAINDHLTWAVRYQVQGWEISKIAETYSKSYKTVAEGIDKAINFVGLVKRPSGQAGRKRGSTGTRKLTKREKHNSYNQLERIIEALKRVPSPDNRAAVAKAADISPNYFRNVVIRRLLNQTGCSDYESLISNKGQLKLAELAKKQRSEIMRNL